MCRGYVYDALSSGGAARHSRVSRGLSPLTLEECLSNESVDRVWNEQMDVAIILAASGNGHGLAVTPLLDEPMVVALPSTHALAQTKSGSVDAIGAPHYVDPESGRRRSWYHVCPVLAQEHEHGRRHPALDQRI